MTMFLGKEIDYWLNLQTRVEELSLDKLMDEITSLTREITKLRGAISLSKSRANQIIIACEESE